MALHRFKTKDETEEPVLCHFGRSIKDGAPGVGTGNWRRDGSSSSSNTTKTPEEQLVDSGFEKDYYYKDNYDYTKKTKYTDQYGKERNVTISVRAPSEYRDGHIVKGEYTEETLKTQKELEKNIKKIDKEFRKQAAEAFFESDDKHDWPWAYQPGYEKGYPECANLNKKEAMDRFMKYLGTWKSFEDNKYMHGYIDYVINSADSVSIYMDDGGAYFGHVIDCEYDPKQKKFKNFLMEG